MSINTNIWDISVESMRSAEARLAGPVVACAVILPANHQILYLNDSKKLTAHKREELYDVILREAVAVGIGMVRTGED